LAVVSLVFPLHELNVIREASSRYVQHIAAIEVDEIVVALLIGLLDKPLLLL
jgi:hypothetical protein